MQQASGLQNTLHRRRTRLFRAGIGLLGASLLVACGGAGLDAYDRYGLYGDKKFDNLSVRYTVDGLRDTYKPGESGEVTITIELQGDPPHPGQIVAFLNVVKPNEEQVAHLVFRQASVQPMIFRTPKPAFHYTNGLTTTLRFRISGDAKAGDYRLALQLFPGRNTNPHAVDVTDRIGHVGSFLFTIED